MEPSLPWQGRRGGGNGRSEGSRLGEFSIILVKEAFLMGVGWPWLNSAPFDNSICLKEAN